MANILKLQIGYSFYGWFSDQSRRNRLHIGISKPWIGTLCNIDVPNTYCEKEWPEEEICRTCLKIYRKRTGGGSMKLKPEYTFCLIGKGKKVHIVSKHPIFRLSPWSLCGRGDTHNDTVAQDIDLEDICTVCIGIYLMEVCQ